MSNQTARELETEYEQLAIAATNDYCRFKRLEPSESFPALAKQISVYTMLSVLWGGVARRRHVDYVVDNSGIHDHQRGYTNPGRDV
jgi:hypothetical protein